MREKELGEGGGAGTANSNTGNERGTSPTNHTDIVNERWYEQHYAHKASESDAKTIKGIFENT